MQPKLCYKIAWVNARLTSASGLDRTKRRSQMSSCSGLRSVLKVSLSACMSEAC